MRCTTISFFCNYHLRYFLWVSGKNSDGIILSLGFQLLLLSSMEFLYRVSFFMSGYHILIFFCRYAHIMIQGHMISFCCTIVKLCELKFLTFCSFFSQSQHRFAIWTAELPCYCTHWKFWVISVRFRANS